MKTCKTCVHFDQEGAQELISFEGDIAKSGGLCVSQNISEYAGQEGYQANSMVYSYNEGGSFWVGPEFGCVNHKKKAGVL